LFCRVLPSELKTMDSRARFAMRSRTNYALSELHKVVSGDKADPTSYPDAAPGDDSVVLFLRLPEELKHACAAKATLAGVPLSRWVRGVLTAE
jgi:hypothetical protein